MKLLVPVTCLFPIYTNAFYAMNLTEYISCPNSKTHYNKVSYLEVSVVSPLICLTRETHQGVVDKEITKNYWPPSCL